VAEWTDPEDMRDAVTGDAIPLAWWNATMDDLLFLANPPQAAVRLDSTQAVADETPHTISWDHNQWSDEGTGMWDDLAPGKVVAIRNGPHRIVVHTEYASVIPVDDQTITLEVNSEVRIGPIPGQQLVIETNLAIDDEIEVIVEQSSGDSVNLVATRTRMTVIWSTEPLANSST